MPGSQYLVDSELVVDLLLAGGYTFSNRPDLAEIRKNNERYGNVCLFVRESNQPYVYFGKVCVSEVRLTCHPIEITWILEDYSHLSQLSIFQHFVNLTK
jgi:hypothetical protein